MEENEENGKNVDKIKVFSSEDEKLKILGELLSNKSSLDIIKLLIEKEMYTNEIAKKLNLRVNLVIYHLKKLEELGLLKITHKTIVKKGNDHRYFRMIPNLFITVNETKGDLDKKGILEKIFKEGMKFATIGIAGLVSWILVPKHKFGLTDGHNTVIDADPNIIWIPLVVIILGLIVERISVLLKKKKN